jgi:hypothetical protein
MKVTRRTFLEVMTVAAAAAPAAVRAQPAPLMSFALYAKIDKHRAETRLAHPSLPSFSTLPVLPFAHPYFEFRSASAEIAEPGETPVCC